MTTRLLTSFALATLLVPAGALAQAPDQDDPDAPPPATVEPAPAPAPPVVIVNPPPRTMVVTQIEPGYETYTDTWNAPLFTSGALVFLASYGASVIVAANYADDEVDRGSDRLYVPVVGPWLALKDRPDCPIANEDCDLETTKKVLLVADGVLQAGGVVTMIAALLSPTQHRVATRPMTTSKKVRVSPSASGGNAGVSIFGRF
ncbi:MAG: hypothetical protein M3680_24025 [Myxococcota bacterium]|nr:hypothetical protein [Myxococcota bacterium]